MGALRLHNFLKVQATGESFMAGDFPVTVIQATGSGSYSGTGFVEVPYLGDTKLKVVFNNITLNTDKKLIAGVVETTYDPKEKNIVSTEDIMNELKNLGDLIKSIIDSQKKIETILSKGTLDIEGKKACGEEAEKITNQLEKIKDKLPEETKKEVEEFLDQAKKLAEDCKEETEQKESVAFTKKGGVAFESTNKFEKWFGSDDCSQANVEKFKEGLKNIAETLEKSKGEKEDIIVLKPDWKIEGRGGVHEKITEIAAKNMGIEFNDGLDEGCAWPDVPCNDPNKIETCYLKSGYRYFTSKEKGTIFYESHFGRNQYWHSMAPVGNFTNSQVRGKIFNQAQEWFNLAMNASSKELGYFHIGKLLHMVQDSYSRSHVIRDSNFQIIQFQSYNAQSKESHSNADKEKESKEFKEAIKSSTIILGLYQKCSKFSSEIDIKDAIKCKKAYLEEILMKIYSIKAGREQIQAGGSKKEFKK